VLHAKILNIATSAAIEQRDHQFWA